MWAIEVIAPIDEQIADVCFAAFLFMDFAQTMPLRCTSQKANVFTISFSIRRTSVGILYSGRYPFKVIDIHILPCFPQVILKLKSQPSFRCATEHLGKPQGHLRTNSRLPIQKGGLDVFSFSDEISYAVEQLHDSLIPVSLFVDPYS